MFALKFLMVILHIGFCAKTSKRRIMTRKKNKPVSYDAMVKFFLQYHNIPTKKDMDRIIDHLNRIELMIKSLANTEISRAMGNFRNSKRIRTPSSAADAVWAVIKNSDSGLGISRIQSKTGFDEKKLRNIIYRLNKTGRIKRKSRGLYVASNLRQNEEKA
jgi:hypothetical protein